MKNINDEYPVSCLPTNLNNRTGKARNCPFEAIDLILYDDNAHMLAFHTTLERIQPWIKTLSIFYFENENKHEITWRDEPDPWSNQNDVANSIVIEVADVNKILQYGITFFVTTGTIRVQGSKYKHFAEKEFPILKEILAIVLDSMAKINNAIDKHTEVEDETTLKTVDSAQSQNIDKDTNLADRSKATIQSDTSCELNDAIKKVEISREKDSDKILKSIESLSNMCEAQQQVIANITSNLCQNTETTKLQKKIQILQEENQSLKSQLQVEKGNVIILKEQHEDTTKHYKSMLEETRLELRKLITNNNDELEFNANKLKKKNSEIESLKKTRKCAKNET